MIKIMIVDDDPVILEMITDLLLSENYEVIAVQNGEKALSYLETSSVDLLILDVMMPKMNGWELAAFVNKFLDIPILFLTAKGTLEDKVKGFALGADDYLVKPFLLEELSARIKVILKRKYVSNDKTIRVKDVFLDFPNHHLVVNNQAFDLPLKEAELLYYMLQNHNQTLTREQLLIHVWGYNFDKDERTLDVHIKRIREKLQQSQIMIATIRGVGYRLEEKNEKL